MDHGVNAPAYGSGRWSSSSTWQCSFRSRLASSNRKRSGTGGRSQQSALLLDSWPIGAGTRGKDSSNPFRSGRLPPAKEVFVMKAVVESIGKVGSRASVGGHELVFDQPTTVPGGAGRGPSPLDVMSVSVAACAHYFAAAYLHGRGLSPEGFTVEVVGGEGARPGIAHRAARRSRCMSPPVSTSASSPGIERAIKSCPAYGTLLHPPTVEVSIERTGRRRRNLRQHGRPDSAGRVEFGP